VLHFDAQICIFYSIFGCTVWVQSGFFTVANQAPPVIQPIVVSNGAVTLTWTATAGRSYGVEYKANLTDPAWLPLGPDVVAGGPTASITDQPLAASRFFRVVAR